VSFKDSEAFSCLHLPQPNGSVSGAGEGKASIGAHVDTPDVACVSFKDSEAFSCLHLPQPNGSVTGSRERAPSVRTQCVGPDNRVFVIELEGLFRSLFASGCFFHRRLLRWRTTGFEELCILCLLVSCKPVDKEELRQGTFERSVVKTQRKEAALLIEGIA